MKKGFTIVEILIVLAIILLLALIAIPNLMNAKKISDRHMVSEIEFQGINEIKIESHGYEGWLGKVKVDGTECVYLIGSAKGGISCDWNKPAQMLM